MKKQENNFAFIDSQNVYKGTRRDLGWRLDWRRFRVYLKHKYDISQAYLFIGFLPEHNDIYDELQKTNDENQRVVRMNQEIAQTSRAELSKNESKMTATDRVFRDVVRDHTHVRNVNALQEDTVNRMRREIKALALQAERSNSTASFDDAIKKIEDINDILKQKRQQILINPTPVQQGTQQPQ